MCGRRGLNRVLSSFNSTPPTENPDLPTPTLEWGKPRGRCLISEVPGPVDSGAAWMVRRTHEACGLLRNAP